MSARVRVDRDHDGQLVAVKQALDPEARTRLVHEAAVLALARHPGVVRSRGLREVAGTLELVTTWVGSRSLADRRGRAPAQIAAILAAIAETVADLHDLGVIHGQLGDPSHVLFDQRDRPVLCGFGRAEIAASSPAEAGAACRSDDVRSLGQLLSDLVELDSPITLMPLHRFRRHQRADDGVARALLTLADHASADDPTCRPTARALARALQRLAPDRHNTATGATAAGETTIEPSPERLERDSIDRLRASAPAPSSRGDWSRLRRVAAGAASIGCIAVLAIGVFSGPTSSPPEVALTGADPSPSGAGLDPPPAPPAPPTTVARPEPPVVELDGHRYELGTAGDEVLVGDWRCDGQPQAALLRPSTGEVFVFDGWATTGADLQARLLARLQPGAHLRGTNDGGCERLVGVLGDGQVIPLPPTGPSTTATTAATTFPVEP